MLSVSHKEMFLLSLQVNENYNWVKTKLKFTMGFEVVWKISVKLKFNIGFDGIFESSHFTNQQKIREDMNRNE